MKELRIGLLGFGTVGTGVVKHLQKNGELIGARTGVRPVIHRIADVDLKRDRGVTVDPKVLTNDAGKVIADPAVDVVVELIGGTDQARRFILQALGQRKPVVTANKALLATHGDEIFAAARAADVDLYYEASVAGGIPIIKSLREGLAANHIECIYGILNGTCNYILTRMEREGLSFKTALKEAQKLGYAEADPALDINGDDTAHKTTILAGLAYGTWFGMADLHVEGIRQIQADDIRNATRLGYRIKQLGIVKLEQDHVQMRVHPTLIPEKALLANVMDVFNAVYVRGDVVGETLFYGRGAGQDATASAVIADLVDVGLNLKYRSPHRVSAFQPLTTYTDCLLPMGSITCRYYLRLTLADQPGVLASIAQVLGDHRISIASVSQTEWLATADSDTPPPKAVPVVFVTHRARESDMAAALAQIEQLEILRGKPVRLRIEDI